MPNVRLPLWLVVPASFALWGCPPAEPAKTSDPALPTASSATSTATAEAPSDRFVKVVIAYANETPMAPVIDGNVAEWGELPEGASAVVVSISDKGANLVAGLSGAAKQGIWVLLAGPVGTLPELGIQQPDGQFVPFECNGEEHCKGDMDKHNAWLAKHEARFERWFRLDPKAIRVPGANGLEPLAGAKVASTTAGDNVIVEAALPLSALPRTSEVPMSTLLAYAASGPESAPPKVSKEDRTEISTPDVGVLFETLGGLRTSARGLTFKEGFSYEPSRPEFVEIVDYEDRLRGGTTLVATEKKLWTPLTKLGDLDLGYVNVAVPYLGILRGDEVEGVELIEGEPKGFVERDGAIHVFSYLRESMDALGATFATWKVIAVDASGKVTTPIDESNNLTSGFKSVDEFHNDKLDAFGVRGFPAVMDEEEQKGAPKLLEIRWTWNKKSKQYVSKSKTL